LFLIFGASATTHAREYNVKFTPGMGYVGVIDANAYNIRNLVDLTVDAEFSVEATKHIYPLIDVLYANAPKRNKWFSGGLNSIGINLGIKWVIKPDDYHPETNDIIDRIRYWFSGAFGPYITYVTSSTGGRHAGATDAGFGASVGLGFDYYFSNYIGIGGQAKLAYVAYSDPYLIVTAGPSLCVRF